MKILVLHPGALGDIILSLPAVRALRYEFPTAQITLAGNPDFARVVAHGYADQVISLATLPLHRLYSAAQLPAEDIAFWESYDRIISWTGYGDPTFTQNLTTANPRAWIASWRPAAGEKRHVSLIFMDTIRPWLSSAADAWHARIVLRDAERSAGERWLRERGWIPGEAILALHPGAGSSSKRWPIDRFEALARRIGQEVPARLLIVEGPAEPGLGRILARSVPANRTFLAETLPLEELSSALSKSLAFVGNDSGIAQLAAGLEIPSVLLFGPTSPELWSPRCDYVSVLRDTRGCSACEGSGGIGHTCLENITVEMCAATLRRRLLERRTEGSR